jgi:3D (Asp-Asp-Asp) domain-containing protein
MRKSDIKKLRLPLLRITAIIAGIGGLVHFSHRECSVMADKPLINNSFMDTSMSAASSAEASKEFHATAYCLTGTTRTGHITKPGLVAADPEIIPLGSVIYVESPLMGGIYQVLDTGDLVKGRIIDIFIPSYEKCLEFGRRIVKVKVLRYGFHSQNNEKKL